MLNLRTWSCGLESDLNCSLHDDVHLFSVWVRLVDCLPDVEPVEINLRWLCVCNFLEVFVASFFQECHLCLHESEQNVACHFPILFWLEVLACIRDNRRRIGRYRALIVIKSPVACTSNSRLIHRGRFTDLHTLLEVVNVVVALLVVLLQFQITLSLSFIEEDGWTLALLSLFLIIGKERGIVTVVVSVTFPDTFWLWLWIDSLGYVWFASKHRHSVHFDSACLACQSYWSLRFDLNVVWLSFFEYKV